MLICGSSDGAISSAISTSRGSHSPLRSFTIAGLLRLVAELSETTASSGIGCSDVNEHVAHLDHTPVGQTPTFDELDQAVNTLGELFDRYHLAVTGVAGSTTPTIINDWMAPFQVSWLPRGS